MDNIKWLRVIKEELAILEQLAIGMIEDKNLTIEEVELAISRSKIVVKEFEMLLNQLPVIQPEVMIVNAPVLEETSFELEESPFTDTAREPVQLPVHDLPVPPSSIPPVFQSSGPLVHQSSSPLSSNPPVFQSSSPLSSNPPVFQSSNPLVPPSPSPPVFQSSNPLVPPSSSPPVFQSSNPLVPPSSSPPVFQSSSLPVQQSNSPTVPEAKHAFYHPAPEEPTIINLDDNLEESSKFKITPLNSLREGLNLNDRYLFQRELFNNDKSKLDATVAALDRLVTIKEAVDYLKANFIWNKSEASEKFIHLVKRRFTI